MSSQHGDDDVSGGDTGENANTAPGHSPKGRQEPPTRELAKKLLGGAEGNIGIVVATCLGSALAASLKDHLDTLASLLVVYGATLGILYFWESLKRSRRFLRSFARRPAPGRRPPGGPALDPLSGAGPVVGQAAPSGTGRSAEPAPLRRISWRAWWPRLIILGSALGAGYLTGYWILGYWFARGFWPGVTSLAAAAAATAVLIAAALRWRNLWPGGLVLIRVGRSRMATALACALAAFGLSAGTLVGRVDLVPACPTPIAVSILTSQEDLGAVQAAIPRFEQYEPAHLRKSCVVAYLSAVAAPDESTARSGLESGWGVATMSTIGAPPDVWMPDSELEVAAVTGSLAAGRARAVASAPRYSSTSPGPVLRNLGSIGDSPLVVGVPADDGSLAALVQHQPWAALYPALHNGGIGLTLPSPTRSATGLLEFAGLYRAIGSRSTKAIERSGSFPPDSGSLLCAADEAAQQNPAQASTPEMAYLISEVALANHNAALDKRRTGLLDGGACAALTGLPHFSRRLTALYPAGAPALTFPFVTVRWGDHQDRDKTEYENDFYRWLTTSRDGQTTLLNWGIRPHGCVSGGILTPSNGIVRQDPSCARPTTPSATSAATAAKKFIEAQAPAHILIGIDDSLPMSSYLPQIMAAVDAELGPAGAALGQRDSFGVWELPGLAGRIRTVLVPFGPGGAAQQQLVGKLDVPTAHAHSANYDMLTQAAAELRSQAATSPRPASFVILLTDGDGGHDLPGDNFGSVTALFAHDGIKLYIIAFGSAGCTEAPLDHPSQSLKALALATHGSCEPANGPDPRQLLSKDLTELSVGG